MVLYFQNICLAATCPIQVLDNGDYTLLNYTLCNFTDIGMCSGSILIYYCKVHNLLGNAVVTCTEDSTWFPPLGTCTPGEYNLNIFDKSRDLIHTVYCLMLADHN